MSLPDKVNWQIIGHKKIKDYLFFSLLNSELSHAYLFIGPKNVGKMKVALSFVQSILCFDESRRKKEIPCFKCKFCRQFTKSKYPDLYLVRREKDKKQISIEQIRELIHHLNLRTFFSSYKFALIDEAETLSLEAANSFLKTLEEPSPKTILILLSSNEETLPKTIVSRCQIIRFNRVPSKEIYQHLLKLNISHSKAKNITFLAQGRPGRAINLSQNEDFYNYYREKVEEFFEILKSSPSIRFRKIIELVKDFSSLNYPREHFKNLLDIWQNILRDLLLSKLEINDFISNNFKKSQIKNYVKDKNINHLKNLNNFSLFVQKLIDKNINFPLILENFIIKI